MILRTPRPSDPFDRPEQLRQALLPLDGELSGAGWNLDEIADLVTPSTLVDAAVLVGLVPRAEGAHVLLTRRNDALQHHAGQVSFPGGRIDPGDRSPLHAALREAWEEVALEPEAIEPVGYLDPYATITGFRVLPVVARLPTDYRIVPNPGEVADAFEVPLAPLLNGERIVSLSGTWMGRPRSYWEYRVGPHRIWGATAAMLVNLGRRLGAAI
ncbi:CoA pyrophosphatase [Xanthomonadaceae bacterium JHOS43]|nr:CoA pyrophosphatase [Xanthomonadaceae bacterium JHOS43]MCX7563291.1 CoA pyrophosphatase [Xanthomonadaceae bacterium XH05]